MGQPVRRSEGAAHYLRSERRPLSHHAARGGSKGDIKLEKIPADIGEAQGLLWAFDSLYVVVNTAGKYTSGVYRVKDTDNDDMLDKVELLRELEAAAASMGLTPCCSRPIGRAVHRVRQQDEAHAVRQEPRAADLGRGSLAPADARWPRLHERGAGARRHHLQDRSRGEDWEIVATGFRNEYDAAVNRDGELFTYDADMEWDFNTPWYRPTRVCLAVSGSEWGWRNGAGKWPAYYADTLPPVVDIGPGSPTGVCFGYGAKFPEKYQDALFICDWSYGKLYAVHMEPSGCDLHGQAGRVCHRHAAAADGCGHQSGRWGDVFHDWRPEDEVGVVPGDVCRDGVDCDGSFSVRS